MLFDMSDKMPRILTDGPFASISLKNLYIIAALCVLCHYAIIAA